MQIHIDLNDIPFQILQSLALHRTEPDAIAPESRISQCEYRPFGINRLTCPANRRNNASPVGIRAECSGLHQTRADNRLSDRPRRFLAHCARPPHLDQLRRAFAVAGDRSSPALRICTRRPAAKRGQSGCSGVNGSLPASPLAMATTISFVLVSPSTVIILKLTSVASSEHSAASQHRSPHPS